MVSLALTGPVLLAFLHVDGPMRWVMLILGGSLAQMAVPANIVQAQILLPTRRSLASALTMGFCWGTAAMLAPIFGSIADATSLTFALSLACGLPALSSMLALLVPDLRDDDGSGSSPEPPFLPPAILESVDGEQR